LTLPEYDGEADLVGVSCGVRRVGLRRRIGIWCRAADGYILPRSRRDHRVAVDEGGSHGGVGSEGKVEAVQVGLTGAD